MTDKLEAVRLASMRLNAARDEEYLATHQEAKQRAKLRLEQAEREYAEALDALHTAPAG
jgi:hypothetical protein